VENFGQVRVRFERLNLAKRGAASSTACGRTVAPRGAGGRGYSLGLRTLQSNVCAGQRPRWCRGMASALHLRHSDSVWRQPSCRSEHHGADPPSLYAAASGRQRWATPDHLFDPSFTRATFFTVYGPGAGRTWLFKFTKTPRGQPIGVFHHGNRRATTPTSTTSWRPLSACWTARRSARLARRSDCRTRPPAWLHSACTTSGSSRRSGCRA
jgi:hypothetical protein